MSTKNLNLLTERNGLLPYPITYSQIDPSKLPATADKLRASGYKEIEYYWLHALTERTGTATLWVKNEESASLLVKFWSRGEWEYSLEPMDCKMNKEQAKPGDRIVITNPNSLNFDHEFVVTKDGGGMAWFVGKDGYEVWTTPEYYEIVLRKGALKSAMNDSMDVDESLRRKRDANLAGVFR
jgi:hypothetical protein